MFDDKAKLIELFLNHQVLQFGEFTLKSGAQSPYFFNLGNLDDGRGLAALGSCYAGLLVDELGAGGFDLIFGPAYKGIVLAAATVAALWCDHQLNVPYAYDRKESKQHGEGGSLVGRPLQPGMRVVIIDDVITDGATKLDAVGKLQQQAQVNVVAAVVALDRQEPHPAGGTQGEHYTKQTGVRLLALLQRADIEHLIGSRYDR